MGGIDRMADNAVIEAKKTHREIALSLPRPYRPARCPMGAPQDFDSIYFSPDMESVPRRVAIVRANRYMVDHVDYLIAYAWRLPSNTQDLVEYASNQDKVCIVGLTNRCHT